MRDVIIRSAVGAFVVVGLGACDRGQGVNEPAPENVEVAETESAVDVDVARDETPTLIDEPIVVPVAQCLVPDDYFADGMTPACTLVTADAQGFALSVTPPAEESETRLLEIDVAAQDGSVVQTITETIEGTYATASLNDLNGDGAEELLVPMYTGNVNTVYALWTRAPGGTQYVRVGEISGVSFEIMDAGVFGVPARASAAEWEIEYYQLNGEALEAVASVSQNLADDTCTVVDMGAYELLGLTEATAEEKLCTIS